MNVTVDGLKQQLADGQVGRLYVFFGEEAFLREHYLRELAGKLVPEGLACFNDERLDGAGLSFVTLRDAVWGVPLMCDKKLVVVTDFDLFKADAETKKNLEAFLAELPESCCLVFYYDVLVYKPDGRAKLADTLKKHAQVVDFAVQEEAQLVRWIGRHFKAQGKRIEPSDASYLLFRCGNLMHTVKREVDKLSAYVSGERVTRADIDRVTVAALDAQVFDLTGAIADNKPRKALDILAELTQMREEPVMILGAIGRQLRALYAARLIADKGLGVQPLMEVMGYRSAYPARLTLTAARKRSIEWCRNALLLCEEADRSLKTSGRDKERALELLLVRLL